MWRCERTTAIRHVAEGRRHSTQQSLHPRSSRAQGLPSFVFCLVVWTRGSHGRLDRKITCWIKGLLWAVPDFLDFRQPADVNERTKQASSSRGVFGSCWHVKLHLYGHARRAEHIIVTSRTRGNYVSGTSLSELNVCRWWVCPLAKMHSCCQRRSGKRWMQHVQHEHTRHLHNFDHGFFFSDGVV